MIRCYLTKPFFATAEAKAFDYLQFPLCKITLFYIRTLGQECILLCNVGANNSK